jgi:hypothetical protein
VPPFTGEVNDNAGTSAGRRRLHAGTLSLCMQDARAARIKIRA